MADAAATPDVVPTLTADAIRAAAVRLHGHVLETPCLPSRTLGAIAGCNVFLKFENLQFTASFKEREIGRASCRERVSVLV